MSLPARPTNLPGSRYRTAVEGTDTEQDINFHHNNR